MSSHMHPAIQTGNFHDSSLQGYRVPVPPYSEHGRVHQVQSEMPRRDDSVQRRRRNPGVSPWMRACPQPGLVKVLALPTWTQCSLRPNPNPSHSQGTSSSSPLPCLSSDPHIHRRAPQNSRAHMAWRRGIQDHSRFDS